jgi:peptide-methionine (S)-S-oxide reductase
MADRKLMLSLGLTLAALVLLPLAAHLRAPALAQETAKPLPSPALDLPPATGLQKAVLSGGCFWGVQGVFEHVRGIRKVLSGYAGGTKDTASYEVVSSGATGHAESVEISYDPKQITYGEILRIFFSVALDPTQVDGQGPDSGTQYRSEVFAVDADQRRVAQAYIAQLERAHVFGAPIATRVDPDTGFYPAEDYHQDYLVHHPDSMYIVFNDLPKVASLKRLFPERYVETPVLAMPERNSND